MKCMYVRTTRLIRQGYWDRMAAKAENIDRNIGYAIHVGLLQSTFNSSDEI